MSGERKGSTGSGIMHSIKQSFLHKDKHVDQDYETTYSKFSMLTDSLQKIRASAQNYVSAVYSVFLHANNASGDFALLLEDATTAHPYQQLCAQLKGAHSRLSQERQQHVVSGLTDRVIRPIDETLKSFIPLQERVQRRNQLHSELEYYLNKIQSLDKERSERTAKGKAEKQKDIEKYDRNQDKLSKARFEYQSFTSLLMADLTTAWNARVALVGPALAAFVEAGKQFVQVYGMELAQVNNSDQLVQAPTEVLTSPTHPSEVPLPTVEGDMHAAKPNAQAGAELPPEGQYTPISTATVGLGAADVPSLAPNDPINASGAAIVPQTDLHSTNMPAMAPMPSPNIAANEPVGVASSNTQSDAVGDLSLSTASPTARNEGVDDIHSSLAHSINDTTSQSMSSQQPLSSTIDTAASDASQPSLLDRHTAALGGGADGGEFLQASTAAIPRESQLDPTTLYREQAGYSHESTKPGMESHQPFDITDSGVAKSPVLKSQGEEESKRQRYEEDNKFVVDAVI